MKESDIQSDWSDMLVYCSLKGRRFDINTILLQVAIEEKKKKIKTNNISSKTSNQKQTY